MENRRDVLELFEKDSGWREKAEHGIEEHRKGNGKITVCDKNGKAVSGARIKLTQKTHEFKFGANIFMLDELETEEKNTLYKKYFAELFNMATLPFYWDTLEPVRGEPRYDKNSPKIYRRPAPDLCIEFCEQHGIEPREHALAYDHFFPTWLKSASVDEIKAAYEKRCAEIAERYADKIPTIEVTNEMAWREAVTSFYDEPDFVEWCFKTARKYFKNNQLCINEWVDLPWGDLCRPTDKYYAYIEANMLKGAPIDAIGMQYHMFFDKENEYEKTRVYYNPERLYKIMDLYSNFKKPLQVTEVTVPAYSNSEEDEELQAEIIKNLYTLWFSHPNMEQIIYWNLVDGYAAFAPQGDMTSGENVYFGGLLRFDFTPKPAYRTLCELIKNVWHTEKTAETSKEGTVDFRGFFGKYDVQIEADGKQYTKELTLSSKTENSFNIVL